MPDHLGVLRRLLVPIACVGCGRPHTWWCPRCAADVGGGGCAQLPGSDLILSSAAQYRGAGRDLVLGLKERHITALAVPLSALLVRAIRDHPDFGQGRVIVPVPATGRSRRRRGFDVVDLLLSAGPPLPVSRCLVWRRRPRSQKSLHRLERARNLAGALEARSEARSVILVDDVVTTGATTREAVRAVRAAGGTVVAVASVCHTPASVRPDPARRTRTSTAPRALTQHPRAGPGDPSGQ